MIDIHCHILPGIDDGPKSWESAVTMCEQAIADGVTHIVATPHANFEYEYNREYYIHLLDELRAKVPGLTFSIGCDFHLSYENVEDAIAHPTRYTINQSRFLLVEFADLITRHNYSGPVFELSSAGFVPIITHPERNPLLAQNPSLVHELVEAGCKVQITANSLTGFWGSTARKVAQDLLKDDLVHFIASDAHDTRRRTTGLSEAVKAASKIVGDKAAARLVTENPREVIA